MLRCVTIAQLRAMVKPTTVAYHDFCKQIGQEPKSVDLEGVSAHWIGSSDADVVILYLHGMSVCSLIWKSERR